ncbi:serine/threonine protein kinase [Gleimia sp. 6138-11-ORH1]|uniref:serine/threonine-protein kinase n=1 Tax=Gleimia sp. 6138-11-ORH1 TaxID=2973937 RepID=UPI002169AA0B|nr:serine/threonine-protein kinase [Gleimia sp. 6138-11-ORH1]MCS4485111.1 serine/threonine protein kinase [Gleimia sp. 6138-11-ORH1]
MNYHAATSNHPGKVIGGRYTLITQLAIGGMGEVWAARDQITARKVAIKVLKPELAGQEAFLTRLRIEAQNAMQIRHQNIAAVLDHGELNGVGWIVMELVEGRPFNEFLQPGHRLSPAEVVPVLIQIAHALQAAKTSNVVHRDIKPSNILITDSGIVKLTDFGISTMPNQVALTDVGMVMGTAQYLSPEQAMGESATHLSDLYALGVIAYEALCGRRPFTGKTQVDIAFAHVNDPVPELPAFVPNQLRKLILRMLRKHPKDRQPDFTAVIRELEKAAKSLEISTAPRPVTLPQTDSAQRSSKPADRLKTPLSSSAKTGSARRKTVLGRPRVRRKLADPLKGQTRALWLSQPADPANASEGAAKSPTRPRVAGASTDERDWKPKADLRPQNPGAKAADKHLFSPYGPLYGGRTQRSPANSIRHQRENPNGTITELLVFGLVLFLFSFIFFYIQSSPPMQTTQSANYRVTPVTHLIKNTPSEVQKW